MSKPKRGMSLDTLVRAVKILRNHHMEVDGPGFTFPSDDHLKDYLRDPVRYMREVYGKRDCFKGVVFDWNAYAPIEDDEGSRGSHG